MSSTRAQQLRVLAALRGNPNPKYGSFTVKISNGLGHDAKATAVIHVTPEEGEAIMDILEGAINRRHVSPEGDAR